MIGSHGENLAGEECGVGERPTKRDQYLPIAGFSNALGGRHQDWDGLGPRWAKSPWSWMMPKALDVFHHHVCLQTYRRYICNEINGVV